jgi:hypothetical protein
MSSGTITLVNSLDKTLANPVPPNHHGITYVWPHHHKSSMTKGFAIFLDRRLATTSPQQLCITNYATRSCGWKTVQRKIHMARCS